VLDGMAEGLVLVDADYRVLAINKEGLRPENRRREDILGRTLWEAWPGTMESVIGRVCREAMTEGKHVEVVHEYTWPTGHRAWLEIDAYPSHDGLAIFYRDISGRKALEDRQQFLLELNDAVRDLADAVNVTCRAAEILGLQLGAGRAGYGHIDAAQTTITVERDWSSSPMATLAGEARLLDGFGPAVIDELKAGRTLVVDDFRTDSRAGPTYAATWESIGTRALVVVPLLRGDVLRSIFYVHQAAPRTWTTAGVELIRLTAERTRDAEERARIGARHRESRERLALETQALELINQTGAQIADELNLEKLVQTVVNAAVQLTRAKFGAFFYNVHDTAGERYMLYALRSRPSDL
jgi:GAF domain-containing protein